jgi:hypothetical protein
MPTRASWGAIGRSTRSWRTTWREDGRRRGGPASWPPSGVATWTCYVELARWSSRQPRAFRRSWTTWPTAWTGCTRRLVCTQRVPTGRWLPSGRAKGLVGDQALVVEVGRLELPCLVIHVYRHHAALIPEFGC